MNLNLMNSRTVVGSAGQISKNGVTVNNQNIASSISSNQYRTPHQ